MYFIYISYIEACISYICQYMCVHFKFLLSFAESQNRLVKLFSPFSAVLRNLKFYKVAYMVIKLW